MSRTRHNLVKRYDAQLADREETYFYVAREVTPDPQWTFRWYSDAQDLADDLGNGYRVWVGPSLPSFWSRTEIVWNWQERLSHE